jgi:protein O-GlcNAc transferase
VLRLPHCYQPNDRKRVVAEPLSRHEYGLPEHGFVFCCFNQTYKITPDVYAVWMRLLASVPGSVLWLVDAGATTKKNLQHAARAGGIDPARLIFAPRQPYSVHLARYRVAGLALDTFPYTSHTTLSDALWCGCPTVGLVGDTFAARVAGSILSAAGLAELICATLADYEQMALRLATDAVALAQVRSNLVQARDCAPLFDSVRFARDLGQLYAHMIAERKTAV